MGANLVTRAEYKTYIGLVSPSEDAEIDLIIPKASALVKNICRRSFVDYVSDAKTEYINGGSPFLVPSEFPVLSISSFEMSKDYGATYTELVEYTDWVLDIQDQVIRCIGTSEFPYLTNGYKLTYTAGYENIPEDLKIAVLDLVHYYRTNEMAVHSNKAPGTNSVQIEYVTTTNLPAHIKRVLDLYTANYN